MNIEMLTGFFMWCSIINVGLLLLSFLMMACAGDFVYRLHSQWYPMPRETFNVALYALTGGYKIVVLVFNIVPWIALTMVS